MCLQFALVKIVGLSCCLPLPNAYLYTKQYTMKRLLVASTSTVHGKPYLSYLLPELAGFFKKGSTLLFIPYARPGGICYEAYTSLVQKAFKNLDIDVKGIHQYDDPVAAVEAAAGIFVGGGNTFLLVNELYKQSLMPVIRQAVDTGTPYLGTSAGSNIAGITMQTTNDMPIVYPPSFDTLGLLPFNLNPHYLDPDPTSTHMGETRETRILEYHQVQSTPVLGLREGSWLAVCGADIQLKGSLSARLFRQGVAPVELSPETDLASFV